uniref:hypothetical protein n=1 Tax=Actinoplanes rectilineatus TaxID=113571 RepID=UPI0005F2940C
PVTVIGFSWNNSRIGPNDSPGQDTIPYAAIRETIVRHPESERLLNSLQDRAGDNPTFLHTGDADVAAMDGLFNNADTAINSRPDLQIISGGYTLDNAPSPQADQANHRDQQVRQAMAKVDPRSVYMPEPNTFVRVDHRSLETDVTFGVRNDPQGDLKYTSKEGRGLAQSVAQQRLFPGMDPRLFGSFDPSIAIQTQAERLLQNYDPANPDAVPQSHADRETWKKQVQNYIQTFYPDMDARQADALTQLAFKSVTPISPATQQSIADQLTNNRGSGTKTLIQVAGATHKALADNPHTPSQAPPAAAPRDVAVPAPVMQPQHSQAWQDAYDNAEQKQLRTERYNPSKDTIVPGTHLLRGEITTIDFTSRD